MKKFNRKRPRIDRKKTKFKPNRAYVEKSVENFLRDGGRINRIILDEKSYEKFVVSNELPGAVDEFLSCNSEVVNV